MAIRPEIDLAPFTDPTLGVNGGRTLNNINVLDSYLSDVIICRQSSAITIGEGQSIAQLGLQPGSIVRLGPEGRMLITPSVAPAFADGGYNIVDKTPILFMRNPTVLPTGEKPKALRQPSYPFHLPVRIRIIASVDKFGLDFLHRDENDVHLATSKVFMEQELGEKPKLYSFLSYFGEDATQPISLNDLDEVIVPPVGLDYRSAVLVVECILTPTFGTQQEDFPPEVEDGEEEGIETSQTEDVAGNITTKVGYYATLEEAYADTRPGRAFACLDPSHPNHLGILSFNGLFAQTLVRPLASTGFNILATNLYYREIRAGSVCNDIDHFAPGDLPPVAEKTINELVAEDAL